MRFLSLFLLIALQCFAISPQNDNSAAAVSPPSDRNEWQKQKQFFKENGYLWIKNFFSNEQTALLKVWAEEINAGAQSILKLAGENSTKSILGTVIVVAEAHDSSQVCRTEDMLSFYPNLHHLVEGTITSYLGQLLSEPYVLFKDKLNFKWPGGGAFPPHQDFPAFELFGPREHVTAMVCIDAATFENGCLQVAKKWRETFAGDPLIDAALLKEGRAVLPYIVGGSNHGSIQPQYVEKISWLALNTSPGDLVLIDSFVPHYSEVNKSTISRRAMFFTLNKLKEGDYRKAYYHAKRNDPDHPGFHFATPTKARNK